MTDSGGDRRLLISGLPGNMALEVAKLVQSTPGWALDAHALTSPARHGQRCRVGDTELTLVGSDQPDEIHEVNGLMAIDYSTPTAAVTNAAWYVQHRIPFVMGTTGYDLSTMRELISAAEVCAVVAPNMATPIVLLQAALRWLAAEFPGGCRGARLSVRESHQQGKRDTSGTAKALLAAFQQLGIDFSLDAITKIREPALQLGEVGVPQQHLAGHAFHRYDLQLCGGTVHLVLEHNVVGRRVYAEGTLRAARFLQAQMAQGERGILYSMEDVLRNMNLADTL